MPKYEPEQSDRNQRPNQEGDVNPKRLRNVIKKATNGAKQPAINKQNKTEQKATAMPGKLRPKLRAPLEAQVQIMNIEAVKL